MMYIPAVLVTAGIAVLSLTESTHTPSVSLNDKVVHGAMYAVLALAWLFPLHKLSIINCQLSIYAVVLISMTMYGALLELLQHYCTLTRSGEWLDLLADFVGALVGISIVVLLKWLNSQMTK